MYPTWAFISCIRAVLRPSSCSFSRRLNFLSHSSSLISSSRLFRDSSWASRFFCIFSSICWCLSTSTLSKKTGKTQNRTTFIWTHIFKLYFKFYSKRNLPHAWAVLWLSSLSPTELLVSPKHAELLPYEQMGCIDLYSQSRTCAFLESWGLLNLGAHLCKTSNSASLSRSSCSCSSITHFIQAASATALSLLAVSSLLSSSSPSSKAARILRSASWCRKKDFKEKVWGSYLDDHTVKSAGKKIIYQFFLHLLGSSSQLSSILTDQETPSATRIPYVKYLSRLKYHTTLFVWSSGEQASHTRSQTSSSVPPPSSCPPLSSPAPTAATVEPLAPFSDEWPVREK